MTPRQLLAAADHAKAIARAASLAQTFIRLGHRPEVRGGLLGFWPRNFKPVVFDAEATAAVYDALAQVEDNYTRKAREYEAKVEAKP